MDQGSVEASGLWVQGKNKLKYKIQESLVTRQFLYEPPNKYIYKMNIHSLLKDCVFQALIYITHKILKRIFYNTKE